MATEGSLRRKPIPQIYSPNGDEDEIVVYVGDLDVETSRTRITAPGQLELRLFPRASFVARFSGPPDRVSPRLVFEHDATVAVPQGRPLTPPSRSSLPSDPGGRSWIEIHFPVSHLEAGDPRSAVRFVVHLSQSFQQPEMLRPVELSDGASQCQVVFSLPGWNLVLAPIAEPNGDGDFGAVVEATPLSSPVDATAIEELKHRLFFILSLISSREVGIGPICGLSQEEEIVWAAWGSPVLRPQKSIATWCPGHLVAPALPLVADGYAQVVEDRALQAVVDRAINHLLSADSPEVLDVRVPVACSGLEVLSWAVLRRQGWIAQDTFRQMNAGAALRLLIAWSGIDADLPGSLPALIARRKRLGQRGDGGPEVLFNVRNAVIHPPRSLDAPDWPSVDELFESWQLATWYLQLVVLRVLGYEGEYWSRLRLGRSVMDVEPVPWATN
jgi:hypothetical protein